MSTVLLRRLVDDAALFPPASAPMGLAVATHRALRVGPLSGFVGRFSCPASRIGALSAQLNPDDQFVLGLVADTGITGLPTAIAEVRSDPRLRLDAVEVPVGSDVDLVVATRQVLLVLSAETMREARAYVELPAVPGWRSALDVLAAAGQGAKLRTGGLSARAFPSEQELGRFITTCAAAEVPFTCTAGLEHAVRHTDPATGFEHHGFLNLLLAATAVARGDDPLPMLSERNGSALVTAFRAVDRDTSIKARALFTAFGSCSVIEPAEDLLALGILEEAA